MDHWDAQSHMFFASWLVFGSPTMFGPITWPAFGIGSGIRRGPRRGGGLRGLAGPGPGARRRLRATSFPIRCLIMPPSSLKGHGVRGIDSTPIARMLCSALITRPAFGLGSAIRRGHRRGPSGSRQARALGDLRKFIKIRGNDRYPGGRSFLHPLSPADWVGSFSELPRLFRRNCDEGFR
jgi:hypothetical protein